MPDSVLKRIPTPSKWNNNIKQSVYMLALLGATEKQMAFALNVSISTLASWKRTHPEFLDALRKGKTNADARVAAAFYESCIGGHYDEEKAFMQKGWDEPKVVVVKRYIPPNGKNCLRWLAARDREHWSEKKYLEVTNKTLNLNMTTLNLDGLPTEALTLIQDIQKNQPLIDTTVELEEDNDTD